MIRKISKKQIWRGSTQLAPLPAVMAACGGNKGWKQNIITLAWTGIVCSDPPMLGISIRPERYSFEIIHDTGEFTLNIPTARLANLTDWCGVVSGRDHDKFQERNLSRPALLRNLRALDRRVSARSGMPGETGDSPRFAYAFSGGYSGGSGIGVISG